MLRRRPAPVVTRIQAALFGLMLAAASALLVIPLVPATQQVHEGEVAATTLTAEHDAEYESETLTQRAREEAAQKVQPVALPSDPSIRETKLDQVDQLLNDVRLIRGRTELTAQQQLEELDHIANSAMLSQAARRDILALDRATFDDFAVKLRAAVADILNRPVPGAGIEEAVQNWLTSQGLVSSQEGAVLRETLIGTPGAPADSRLIVQNFQIDEQATQAKKDAARANVTPIFQYYSKGQVIANQGETLTASAIEALRETGYIEEGFDYYKVAGGLLFAAGFGALIGTYLYQVQPFSAAPTRRLLLIAFSVLAALVAARLVIPAVTPDHDGRYYAFALPLAAAAIITASFADLPFAAVIAVASGLFAAFIAAAAPDLAGSGFVTSVESLELGLAYTAGGLAGAIAVQRAERLSRYMFAAVAVALATGLVLGAFWLIGEPRSNETLGWLALAAGINGVGSAVVAVGVFVLLSMVFGVTTRLQLMELAQSDHPLLRRLQDEAPGTYHHSMMVGALAERGADSIGADSLVVRVGAYYHDIGKLAQPQFYVENMLDSAESPHDTLDPERSAAIIREHVTNGMEIAARYRLPAIVRDFIPQHHGTRLVTYFYRKAAQKGPVNNPEPYRYFGPRPQTKETAIVMLADSCEAIVRANQDRGQQGIDELIDNIFAERLAEGQLDDCDLTMRELQQVASSFKATLKAIYHPRIAYPAATQEEIEKLARAQDPAPAP